MKIVLSKFGQVNSIFFVCGIGRYRKYSDAMKFCQDIHSKHAKITSRRA